MKPNSGLVVAGKYRLGTPLGRGGFGTVWRARHLDLNEDVALKILDPQLARDEEGRRRFLREVQATTSFVHEYAVQLRDFGRDTLNDILYFTMDIIEGPTLREVLDDGDTMEPRRAVTLACQVLEVLEKAHAAGFVHRDLKPRNLILTRGPKSEEQVRVLDFGIAKAMAGPAEVTQLTRPHAALGTIAYMSPEQAKGLRLDGRSDLYSLAVVLYESLSGRLPIEPEEGTENPQLNLHYRIIHADPAPLEGVEPALAAEIERALAKDPADRHADAATFRRALLAAVDPVPRDAPTEPLTVAQDVPPGPPEEVDPPTPGLGQEPGPADEPRPPDDTARLCYRCPGCGGVNRVAAARLADRPVCGRCRTPLDTSAPIEPDRHPEPKPPADPPRPRCTFAHECNATAVEGDSLCRWHRRQISEAASIESSEELPSSSLIDSLGSAGCCLLLVLGIGVVAWRTPDLSPVRSAIGSYVGDLLEGFQSPPAPASSATPTKTPTTTPRTPRLIRESLRLPKYRIGFETSIPSDPVTLILDNGSAQGITVRLDRYRIDVPAGQHAQVTLEAARVSLAVEGFPPLTKTLEKRQTYVYNHLRRNSYLLERRVYALPGAARPTDTEKNVTLRLPQQEFFKTRWPIDYVFEPFPERVEVFVTAMAVKTRLARRR